MSNFVSNEDAQALMQAIEGKKLTVADTMPAASPDLVDKVRLYVGPDITGSFTKGVTYQCQALEVTPTGSEDPQSEGWYIYNSVDDVYELTTDTTVVAGTTYYTIEWVGISSAEVDLSHYKKIWGGSSEAWEQLTDAEKAEYEYMFFDDDNSDYSLKIADALEEGNMNPLSSDAAAKVFYVYSSKNLLPNRIRTETKVGITYTKNDDGSVTIDGTCTATTAVVFCSRRGIFGSDKMILKNGKYIISGCSGGSPTTYGLYVDITQNGVYKNIAISGNGETEFTVNGDDGSPDEAEVQVQLVVQSGTTVNNVTVYPMVRSAYIEDNEFEQFAMTNRDLTPVKLWENPEINSGGNLSYFGAQKISIPTLSNYRFIKIFFCVYERSNQRSDTFINRQEIKGVLSTARGVNSANYYCIIYARYFTINSDGITFEDCIEGHLTGANSNNAYQIPLQIWGSNTP